MSRSRINVTIFVFVTLVCVTVAVSYTLFSARRATTSTGDFTSAPIVASSPASPVVSSPLAAPTTPPQAHPSPPPASERHDQVQARPYVVALNVRDSPDLGTVEFAALESIDDRTRTDLRCERIYVAASKGICLKREIKLFSAQTIATIVDAAFAPLFSVRTDGIPTRARISPDGRYAAFTVFVAGHSYADAELSTTTLLIDIATRATLANLEEFKVLQDGKTIRSLDFNYWGVTFEPDSNFFYATLRTGGVNHLVHGDIKGRTVTIIYNGVECPSLSPDGTRIAFKKMVARADWRLAVLSLSTFKETPLPETRSVDDQVEWLDNEHVLYALTDPAPWMSIMVVPADGSGQPKIFAKGAASPAIVRQFRQ